MPIVEISMVNLLSTKIARRVPLAADHSSSANPEGISKECGKHGKRLLGFPCFPHSVISMACFGDAADKSQSPRRPVLVTGAIVRDADDSASALRFMFDGPIGDEASLRKLFTMVASSLGRADGRVQGTRRWRFDHSRSQKP